MTPNLTVTTYAELDRWVSAFMRKDGLRLLFVVGNPGVSKSESFKQKTVEGAHRHIRAGRLTAFQLYKQVFKDRKSAIILDDVEDALRKGETARMLMSLCETDQSARRIAWNLLQYQKAVAGQGLIAPLHFCTSRWTIRIARPLFHRRFEPDNNSD